MSAAAELMRKYQAIADASEQERIRARTAIFDYDRSIAEKEKKNAERQQAYTDSAVAVASGLPEHENLPDAQLMEKTREEVAVAPLVRKQLENVKINAELAAVRDKRLAEEAQADFIFSVGLVPALQEFHNAFDELRDAAIKLMAAHISVFPKGDGARSFVEFYGPAAQMIESLQAINWPNEFRYRVRPNWLPVNGRILPDEMPGMGEARREIQALINEGLAA